MIDTISITDLKQKTAQVVKQVKGSKKPIYILQRSKVAAVIMDPEYLKKIQEALEDAEDIAAIKEWESSDKSTVPFEEVTKKLGL